MSDFAIANPPVERDLRILDFDMESLAAGFADPAWVPQKITVIAWSWLGSDVVESAMSTQMGFFVPSIRATMLEKFLPIYEEADMVAGHNLLRHDLPLLNAESMRLGFGRIKPKLVCDTMRLGKTKGLKKGLDNLAGLLKTQEEKQAMDWQAWEDSYEDPTWALVKSRAESDVRLHMEVRARISNEWGLKRPVSWRP